MSSRSLLLHVYVEVLHLAAIKTSCHLQLSSRIMEVALLSCLHITVCGCCVSHHVLCISRTDPHYFDTRLLFLEGAIADQAAAEHAFYYFVLPTSFKAVRDNLFSNQQQALQHGGTRCWERGNLIWFNVLSGEELMDSSQLYLGQLQDAGVKRLSFPELIDELERELSEPDKLPLVVEDIVRVSCLNMMKGSVLVCSVGVFAKSSWAGVVCCCQCTVLQLGFASAVVRSCCLLRHCQ